MRTKSLPFQLEQDTPGAFLLQGLAGGILVGFGQTLVFILANPSPYSLLAVIYTPIMIVLGIFKAISLWVIYCSTGMRMKAPVRVATSTIALTSLLTLLVYRGTDPQVLGLLLGWSFLVSLPTALLVGSQVKPWGLFTFWSIAVRQHGLNKRLSAMGVPAVGGVVPLRLLSILLLGCWVLVSAHVWIDSTRHVKPSVIFGLIPITYFALSAYLTFRSPRKLALLAIGLVINLPIIYLSFFGSDLYPESDRQNHPHTLAVIACAVFLSAWIAFLAARFRVDNNAFMTRAQGPFITLFKNDNKQQHHCLGSRFLEWHESQA